MSAAMEVNRQGIEALDINCTLLGLQIIHTMLQ
jgi:hypothetical protein